MMFQSYALFPHLSVWDNIAFGLRRDGMPKDEIAARVDKMLDLVQLKAYGKRKPHQLSGGQQQRVALARSLAKRPQLLLLDEPLAALDKKLRERTQLELVDIIEQVGVTCVMVTHDQEEAMTMASRIAVMSEGMILQTGKPHEVYETPNCRFVADFIGSVNMFAGQVEVDEPDHVIVDSPECKHYIGHGITGTIGMPVSVAVRPEKITISAAAPQQSHNCVQGEIVELAYLGSYTVYHLKLASGMLVKAIVSNTARHGAFHPKWGDQVFAHWSDDADGGVDPIARMLTNTMQNFLKNLITFKWLSGRRAVIGVPYLWLLLCSLVPFFIILKISFAEMEISDPFGTLLSYADGVLSLKIKFSNYLFIAQDDLYVLTYINSLKYAAITTLVLPGDRLPVCLLHGTRQAVYSADADDDGDAAVLDFVPVAHLCVEGHAGRSGRSE